MSHIANQQGERHDHGTEDHPPKLQGIIPSCPVKQIGFCNFIATVPGRRILDKIKISPDHGNCKGHLDQFVQNRLGHVGFEAEYIAQHNEQRNDPGTSRVQSTQHKVGRERGYVPTWILRDGKVCGHDGVNRYGQRHEKTGHGHVSHLEIPPLTIGPLPTQRQELVECPACPLGIVTTNSQIRNHPHVQKQQ